MSWCWTTPLLVSLKVAKKPFSPSWVKETETRPISAEKYKKRRDVWRIPRNKYMNLGGGREVQKNDDDNGWIQPLLKSMMGRCGRAWSFCLSFPGSATELLLQKYCRMIVQEVTVKDTVKDSASVGVNEWPRRPLISFILSFHIVIEIIFIVSFSWGRMCHLTSKSANDDWFSLNSPAI